MRRKPQTITRMILQWTPEGKRKRGRPRAASRRAAESKMKAMQPLVLVSLTRLAQDRQKRSALEILYKPWR